VTRDDFRRGADAVRSLPLETVLEVTVVHANVRKQGVPLRRNYIWRPIVAIPFSPKISDQEVAVTWTALESLNETLNELDNLLA